MLTTLAQHQVDVNDLNRKFVQFDVPEAICNKYLNALPDCDNRFTFMCVRQCEVLECLLKLKSNAEGLDGNSPNCNKLLLPLVLSHIRHIVNTAITTSTFPSAWKYAKIVPIPNSDPYLYFLSCQKFLYPLLVE